jgi:hypothetical protein
MITVIIVTAAVLAIAAVVKFAGVRERKPLGRVLRDHAAEEAARRDGGEEAGDD